MIDGFLDRDTIAAINAQWPNEWLKEDGSFNRKWSRSTLPPAAQAVADQVTPEWVSELTGIPDLIADPELFGAGLHCIPAGGFLKMHVDFNRHPNGWHRRVNVLIYLNEVWLSEWGGALQLGIGGVVKYMPKGGRAVIFETTDDSWHGHPKPLACPPEFQRRSLALYFYNREPPAAAAHSTIYKK